MLDGITDSVMGRSTRLVVLTEAPTVDDHGFAAACWLLTPSLSSWRVWLLTPVDGGAVDLVPAMAVVGFFFFNFSWESIGAMHVQ